MQFPISILQFPSSTRRVLLQHATEQMEAAGSVDVPHRAAVWILADVLGCRTAALHAYSERKVPSGKRAAFHEKVTRVAGGEPLQYVLGHVDFFGLRLQVTPDVLIPRPETEQVTEEALRRVQGAEAPRILDAGTGSGCIALALKHERPDAAVWACDVSAAALAVARANAEVLGLDGHFSECDLLDRGAQLPGNLDLLVSNPPYIPEDEADALPAVVRDHEPPEALFCGPDPLRFYHALAAHARRLLAPGGWLVLEAHAPQAGAVRALLEGKGFDTVQVKTDLAGRARVISGRRGVDV